MSKQMKRKITVSLTSKSKTLPKTRPSVFERLGTKATSIHPKEFCHHWAQNGTCPYGKGCKYSSTHTLVSPSKQRAAKSQIDVKHRLAKEPHKRVHGEIDELGQSWNPEELEDADPDDLEKRRQELQRELELQMKMEKAHKKTKKLKKESSPSTESSSSSSDSSSTTEDTSSSSSSSGEVRKKKAKKSKKRDSSSSSEDRSKKHKLKTKRSLSKSKHHEKPKKIETRPTKLKSVSPPRKKQSQTPPPKSKNFVPSKATTAENKSPRPSSRSSAKDKRRTPSPKTRDKEHEKEKEKIKEREREREKEREKERAKERERVKEREKERTHKKKEISPKRDSKSDSKPSKDRKRDSPDSSHSKERKVSPGRSKSGTASNCGSKRDHRSPVKDDRSSKRDERDRSRQKDKNDIRKDCKTSRERERDRERDRERERRIEREEREAAREKERAEALARCQERQRERERLKELQKKDEEKNRSRDKNRRDDRDKSSGDRIERRIHSKDRLPARKGHSIDRDRGDRRDRERRDRSPSNNRSVSRKSLDRHECEIDETRGYERVYDQRAPEHGYERDLEHNRDYAIAGRLRENDPRRIDEKDYSSPYDRTRIDNRRYMDIDEHYEGAPHLPLERGIVEAREYQDDRRPHRDLWDLRDERALDPREREIDPRRYDETRLSPTLKAREWDHPDYALQEADWGRRREWDMQTWDAATEEEWRLYNANRNMEGWQGEDRRGWANWRDNSRARSIAAHRDDQFDNRRRNDHHHRGSRNDRGGRNDHGRKEFNRSDHGRNTEHLRSDHNSRIDHQRNDFPVKTEHELKSDHHEILKMEQSVDETKAKELSTEVNDDLETTKVEEAPGVELTAEKSTEAVEDDEKKENLRKRPGEPIEECPDQKKQCIEPVLEDDLSEISDDADEILNRDEELVEATEDAEFVDASKDQTNHKTQSPNRSPSNRLSKEGSLDEENMDLDFEEISEDELEEESKVKGIGDALGVDWASLVAESRPLAKPISSAKKLWDGNNVLVNLGISVVMAGKEMVDNIMKEHQAGLEVEDKKEFIVKNEDETAIVGESTLNIDPVAAIQVAEREQKSVRKMLFTSAGPYRRALSARRDLMIRRHLCNLPLDDSYIGSPKEHDPELYKQALQLFLKTEC